MPSHRTYPGLWQPSPPTAIQYVSVTKNPHRIAQALRFTEQYGVPTIEIMKDGVVEDLQVRQEHLVLARKMAGLL